jgi:photosystem II stability/assembly factor-like uncharacterized protein
MLLYLALSAAALGSFPADTAPQSLFRELRYRSLGPNRGGRVTAVAGVPDQPLTFYMGASGGGVWKTTNAGESWQNVSDGFFRTPSIGAIRVAESDPDIVYVGTGSSGIRSNVIVGDGVYKSTDAGRTWTHIGLPEAGQIGAVIIHPKNPDVVLVAAIGNPFAPNRERGVYKTTDGGRIWNRVLFLSDSTGAADLEFAPDDPETVYATMWRVERKPWTIISGAREGGIYKSTDGGDTWTRLTAGLPSDLVGKADLAVTPADPNRVYALIEALPGGGLYRSDDRGATWHQVSTQAALLDRPFYYCNVDAAPDNADVVYVEATGFWRSADGGHTFAPARAPHGDHHDLWINPKRPQVSIEANDGGANVSLDGMRTWSTQYNQPTAELYQVNVDDQTPYWLYAGQQDNGTAMAVPTLPPAAWTAVSPVSWWKQVGGCETGPSVPRPGDPDIIYANCKGRFTRLNLRTGEEQDYSVGARDLYGWDPKQMRDRFQRTVPVSVSPHDPNTVYHASQYLYRTRDEGKTWERISPDLTADEPDKQVISGAPITRDVTGEEYYSTIYAVQESRLEKGVIWVGANDGPVSVTRDAGRTWQRVTPPDLPPGGRVQTVEPSPVRRGKAYVAVLRYQLGDWRPYAYRTTNYGTTWSRITTGANGIPDNWPVRVVREDPSREGLLYAGTEYGLFVSFDDGGHWQPFQQNLPVTPVTDIAVHRKDLALSTMGRGFWILDDLSPLHELGPTVASEPAHLFEPRDALRLRYPAREPGPGDPEHPAPGMYFHYSLAADAPGEVKLEIQDPAGAVLRSFSSGARGGARPSRDEAELGPEPEFPRRAAPLVLSTRAGLHRVRWDFTLPGPGGASGSGGGGGGFAGRGARGPMVAPGLYQLRLTVGTWTATRPFKVLIDPRLPPDGVTEEVIRSQVAMSLKIRDLVSESRRVVAGLAELRRRAGGVDSEGARRALTRLGALEDRLVTAPGRYPTPMLADQIAFLYNMTLAADQKLGRDVYERYDELAGLLARVREELDAIVTADLPGMKVNP